MHIFVACHPVLTRLYIYLGLSRMSVARDMIAQLGLNVYAEGLCNPGSVKILAWVRYNLLARENPFGFRLRKTYGAPRRSETEARDSLWKKLIQEIMLEPRYNVDVNCRFCNMACSQFTELHHIAGGSTLMAHCALEKERVAT